MVLVVDAVGAPIGLVLLPQVGRLCRIVVPEHVGLAQDDDAALREPRGLGHQGGVDHAQGPLHGRHQGCHAVLEVDDAVVGLDARPPQRDVGLRLFSADDGVALLEVVDRDAGAP